MNNLEVKVYGLDSALHTARMFPQVVQERTPVVLERVARVALGLMKANVAVQTGGLRSSLYAVLSGRSTIKLGATAPHAVFVEKGTRPHVILPRRPGGVLRFSVGIAPAVGLGRVVFTKRVHHPGTRAQPFMRPAAREAHKLIPQYLWEEIQKWLISMGWK